MSEWRGRCADLLARKGSGDERARLYDLIDLDWERTVTVHPEYATFFGVEGDHGAWTDSSAAARAEQAADLRAIAEVAASIDQSALADEDRLNAELFARQAAERARERDFSGDLLIASTSGPHIAAMTYLPITPTEHRVGRLRGLATVIEQAIERLREGIARGVTTPRAVLTAMPEQMDAFATRENNPLATVCDGDGTAEAIAAVAPAFERFAAFLREEYLPSARETTGLADLPDGREWYAFLVRKFTTTDMTPEQVHEVGLAEVERIGREMRGVVEQTGFTGSVHEFFEFLRTDDRFYFERAEDLLVAYRDIAKRVDPELVKLFGVLPRTPYGVEPVPEATAQRQTTAYYMPGSLQAARPGVFFANTYDLRARPKWEMEALTLHEAVPGHHLQISLAQEMPDVPRFRTTGLVTAFIEGWGLYAESLGPEMGFYEDPYSRFGQLTYEMWRAIRLVVDTGMHALGWPRDRAIEFFRQNAGKTMHDITVEVDRYISVPGQALAYKIGELKFKELRARATEALGDRFDVRAFHDEVLRRGALPLSLLERIVDEWIAASA